MAKKPPLTLVDRAVRIFQPTEGQRRIAPATRGQRATDIEKVVYGGQGVAAAKAVDALTDALTEDKQGIDLGEGAVVSWEDKEVPEKEEKPKVGRLGFPAKKASGGRPVGVGAAKRGYGAVMRKSVGGGLRGVGVAQKGFGAVKKAGKE